MSGISRPSTRLTSGPRGHVDPSPAPSGRLTPVLIAPMLTVSPALQEASFDPSPLLIGHIQPSSRMPVSFPQHQSHKHTLASFSLNPNGVAWCSVQDALVCLRGGEPGHVNGFKCGPCHHVGCCCLLFHVATRFKNRKCRWQKVYIW